MIYGYMIVDTNKQLALQEFTINDIILKLKRAIYNIVEKLEHFIEKAKDSKIKDIFLQAIRKFKSLFKDCDGISNIDDFNRVANETEREKSKLKDEIERFTLDDIEVIDKGEVIDAIDVFDNNWEKMKYKAKESMDNMKSRHQEFNSEFEANRKRQQDMSDSINKHFDDLMRELGLA